MKNSFETNDQNEFLGAGLQNSRMNGSRAMSSEQIINKLQQKNSTLKNQVRKIERVLSSMKMEEKPRYGIILPQIKPDTIKKQLQNAYKQIKIYEHQIQRRRNALSSETAYVEQLAKVQKLYKEKVEIHERLKREMLMIKHESKELIKGLKNNLKKQEYQMTQNKLTTDIKYLKQKVRDFEVKRATHIAQLQKQRHTIKEMQAEFLKENSNQNLEIIKNKIFKPNNIQQSNILTPSRSIMDIENQAAKQQSRVSKAKLQTEESEQITAQNLASIQNDVKLFKKMKNDYENKINLLIKERDQALDRNFKSRNKLLQVEFEIQKIEKNIAELKKLIDPNIFKPKLIKNDEKATVTTKIKTPKILHNYKFVEAGQITKAGKRFSDRALIGRIDSKITAVTFYTKQETQEFVGIQATYRLADQKFTIKKGIINTRLDMKKQAYKEESIKLQEQDYLKSIDVFMNKKKIVGISVVSWKNKIQKAGNCQGQRVALSMKETDYPMCFFGSTLEDGFQCLGVQIFVTDETKE